MCQLVARARGAPFSRATDSVAAPGVQRRERSQIANARWNRSGDLVVRDRNGLQRAQRDKIRSQLARQTQVVETQPRDGARSAAHDIASRRRTIVNAGAWVAYLIASPVLYIYI